MKKTKLRSIKFDKLVQRLTTKQQIELQNLLTQPVVQTMLNNNAYIAGGFVQNVLMAYFGNEEIELDPRKHEIHPLELYDICLRSITLLKNKEQLKPISWVELVRWGASTFQKAFVERPLTTSVENPTKAHLVQNQFWCVVQPFVSMVYPSWMFEKNEQAAFIQKYIQIRANKKDCNRYLLLDAFSEAILFYELGLSVDSPLTDILVEALRNFENETVNCQTATGFVASVCPHVDFVENLDANIAAYSLLKDGNIKIDRNNIRFQVEPDSSVGQLNHVFSRFEGELEFSVLGASEFHCPTLPDDSSCVWQHPELAKSVCETFNMKMDGKLVDRYSKGAQLPVCSNLFENCFFQIFAQDVLQRQSEKYKKRSDIDFYFANEENAVNASQEVKDYISGEKQPLTEKSFVALRHSAKNNINLTKLGNHMKTAKENKAFFGAKNLSSILKTILISNQKSYIKEIAQSEFEVMKESKKWCDLYENWKKRDKFTASSFGYENSLISSSMFVFDNENNSPLELQLVYKPVEKMCDAEEEIQNFDFERSKCFIRKDNKGDLNVYWTKECEEDIKTETATLSKVRPGIFNTLDKARFMKMSRSFKLKLSNHEQHEKVLKEFLFFTFLDQLYLQSVNNIVGNYNDAKVFVDYVKNNLDKTPTIQVLYANVLHANLEVTESLFNAFSPQENSQKTEILKTPFSFSFSEHNQTSYVKSWTKDDIFKALINKNKHARFDFLFTKSCEGVRNTWVSDSVVEDKILLINNMKNTSLFSKGGVSNGKESLQQVLGALAVGLLKTQDQSEKDHLLKFFARKLAAWHVYSTSPFENNDWLKIHEDFFDTKLPRTNLFSFYPFYEEIEISTFLNNPIDMFDLAQQVKIVLQAGDPEMFKVATSLIMEKMFFNKKDFSYFHSVFSLSGISCSTFFEAAIHPAMDEKNSWLNLLRKHAILNLTCSWDGVENKVVFEGNAVEQMNNLIDEFAALLKFDETQEKYLEEISSPMIENKIKMISDATKKALDEIDSQEPKKFKDFFK